MAARLRALSDHTVDAARVEPARLGDGGRRGIDFRPGRSDRASRPPSGRPKWKLTTSGLRRLDHLRHRGVERRAARSASRRRRGEARVRIIGRESRSPGGFASGVRGRRDMAKEIDVDRGADSGADRLDLFAQQGGRQHRRRQRAKAARLRDGEAQLDALRTGHRRLDDRQARGEEVSAHQASPRRPFPRAGPRTRRAAQSAASSTRSASAPPNSLPTSKGRHS